jgi:hypothetical protein
MALLRGERVEQRDAPLVGRREADRTRLQEAAAAEPLAQARFQRDARVRRHGARPERQELLREAPVPDAPRDLLDQVHLARHVGPPPRHDHAQRRGRGVDLESDLAERGGDPLRVERDAEHTLARAPAADRPRRDSRGTGGGPARRRPACRRPPRGSPRPAAAPPAAGAPGPRRARTGTTHRSRGRAHGPRGAPASARTARTPGRDPWCRPRPRSPRRPSRRPRPPGARHPRSPACRRSTRGPRRPACGSARRVRPVGSVPARRAAPGRTRATADPTREAHSWWRPPHY